ncbi:hypothetical protein A2W24_01605 [Microgenomates group bacterium RBG_16_45_19]|nr:MAG: hypothetical protein A2W24_01605 [Microgenomates group bacterium RBG_16_45_19]
MKYHYRLTASILEMIQHLIIIREAIGLAAPAEARVTEIRRRSLLKSALYSAKIEGNPLTETSVLTDKSKHKLEVQQLLAAYEWGFKQTRPLTVGMIKELHRISMANLDETPGKFRQAQTAIFNQAGVAVYLPPPAMEIKTRMDELVKWLDKAGDPVPIKAVVSHFWFEKIHPFSDGNGRVGRVMVTYILHLGNLGFGGMLNFEEVLADRREEYYALLNEKGKEITLFIKFMLESLVKAADKLMVELKIKGKRGPDATLLPRQREIYWLIKDHEEVSFDFVKRRFLAVPSSTIHYDLGQLIKKGLVDKMGQTRGVRYRIREPRGL